MYEIPSLALALLDFVPVALFLIGARLLWSMAAFLCGPRWGRAALIGSLLVFVGGAAKAVEKLVLAAGLGNIDAIGEIHFALQAPGFLTLLIVSLLMARAEGILTPKPNLVMAIATWKVPLLIIMAAAGMGMHGLLMLIAWRRKAVVAAASFFVALVCLLAMGGLASGDQNVARQWLEESVNLLGQLGFMMGAMFLQMSFKNNETRLHPRTSGDI